MIMQDPCHIFDIPKFEPGTYAEIKRDNIAVIRTSIIEMSLKQCTGLLLSPKAKGIVVAKVIDSRLKKRLILE